ncbi:MAG: hypothetical protein ACRD98_01985 [Nitrososphaera sp.]
MAFCGLLLIGFIVWFMTDLLAVMLPIIDSPRYSSLWIDPLLLTISQPIGSVIAISGAYLLLKKRKRIGLYVSAASVPILLINNTWMQFIGVIDWLIFPFLAARQLAPSDFTVIYFVLVGIYNVCTATIGALLAVLWRVTKR